MQTRRECYVCRIFLSTPSVRRATCTPAVTRPEVRIISIHALREEGDLHAGGHSPGSADNFYPRPP